MWLSYVTVVFVSFRPRDWEKTGIDCGCVWLGEGHRLSIRYGFGKILQMLPLVFFLNYAAFHNKQEAVVALSLYIQPAHHYHNQTHSPMIKLIEWQMVSEPQYQKHYIIIYRSIALLSFVHCDQTLNISKNKCVFEAAPVTQSNGRLPYQYTSPMLFFFKFRILDSKTKCHKKDNELRTLKRNLLLYFD